MSLYSYEKHDLNAQENKKGKVDQKMYSQDELVEAFHTRG